MSWLRLLTLFVFLFAFDARSHVEILATVGGKVISTLDVENRAHIMAYELEMPLYDDAFRREVLNLLVDEMASSNHAEEMGIFLSPIDLAEIEAEVGKYTEKFNVDISSLKEKLKARIMWGRIVSEKIIPNIAVSQMEIDDFREHLNNFSNMVVRFKQVMFPVDTSKGVIDLVNERVASGVTIEKIADQFSYPISNVDWIPIRQLSGTVQEKIRSMSTNETSSLVRLRDGYSLIHLIDLSDLNSMFFNSVVDIKVVSLAKGSKNSDFDYIKNRNYDCNGIAKETKFNIIAVRAKVSDLDSNTRIALKKTPVGSISKVMKNKDGSRSVIMLCDIIENEKDHFDDRSIEENIYRRKLFLQQRLYAVKLRKSTPLEIFYDKIGN